MSADNEEEQKTHQVDLENLENMENLENKKMGDARLSKFSRQVMYEGSWTEQTLDLLETWVSACKESAAAHSAAAKIAQNKYRMISIPIIVIGSAATGLSYFAAGDSCDPDHVEASAGLRYSVALLTSIVTILSGVNSLYNFSSKTQAHIAASGSFSNLARRGDLQTWLPNGRRGESEVVLTDISAEYASLTTSSPLL
ncbi:unnamed protein product [Pylaiella littoralis]